MVCTAEAMSVGYSEGQHMDMCDLLLYCREDDLCFLDRHTVAHLMEHSRRSSFKNAGDNSMR